MNDRPSMAIHTFTSRVLMSFSVDETLLVNLSTRLVLKAFRLFMSCRVTALVHTQVCLVNGI